MHDATALLQWYEERPERRMIVETLNGDSNSTSPVSLRTIDWFVTNYSMQKDICLLTNNDTLFRVHAEAQQTMRFSTSKQFFDPFRRGDRITFLQGGKETTLGQLNFFRWAMESGVLQYILDHHSEIKAHMRANRKSPQKNKKSPSSGGCYLLDKKPRILLEVSPLSKTF